MKQALKPLLYPEVYNLKGQVSLRNLTMYVISKYDLRLSQTLLKES